MAAMVQARYHRHQQRTTLFDSNHIPHLTNIIIDIVLSTNVDYQISIIYQAKQPSARPRHVITIYIHALAFHFNTQTTILAAERKKNEEEESEVENYQTSIRRITVYRISEQWWILEMDRYSDSKLHKLMDDIYFFT